MTATSQEEGTSSRAAGHKLRAVMGRFPTGVTIISTAGGGTHAITANAFTSLSLSPPLVLVCIGKTSRLSDLIVANSAFAVSILAADQEHIAMHFANSSRPQGEEQFTGLDWHPAPTTACPVITGSAGWLDCVVREVVPGGDHEIIIGNVVSCGIGAADDALTFHLGTFGSLGLPTPSIRVA